MSLSDLQVFSDYMEEAATEVQDQKIDVFNTATRNGLVLTSGSNRGDVTNTLKYEKISGLIRERDPDVDDDETPLDLARILEGSVKVARGIGPVNIKPALWAWINRDAQEAGAAIGQQLAEDILANRVNTAIMALVAATLVETEVVHDYSGTGTATMAVLLDGAAKLGDRSQSIRCWVMHSKVWFDLVKTAMTNTEALFTWGNVKVMADALGNPFIVTDSPSLKNGSTYYSVGLTDMAAVVEDNGNLLVNTETTNLKSNIQRTYQGEYDMNLGIKGFYWNTSTGGSAPSDAALGSGANWTRSATSHKDLAAVVVASQ